MMSALGYFGTTQEVVVIVHRMDSARIPTNLLYGEWVEGS